MTSDETDADAARATETPSSTSEPDSAYTVTMSPVGAVPFESVPQVSF